MSSVYDIAEGHLQEFISDLPFEASRILKREDQISITFQYCGKVRVLSMKECPEGCFITGWGFDEGICVPPMPYPIALALIVSMMISTIATDKLKRMKI